VTIQPPIPGGPDEAAEALRAFLPAGFVPRAALVLGSGLGGIADRIEDPVPVPYGRIPGFWPPGVHGHAGRLVFGRLAGVEVAVMQGRKHMYEGLPAAAVTTPIRTLKLLGCDLLILTCAAGSLRTEVGPGRLMMVTDHINMQGTSVLVGPNDERFGPRFPPLLDAWDPAMNARLRAAAGAEGIALTEGTYAAWLGPAFETPAEVRMLKMLGGDAVGMSMVQECIAARHCGLTVCGLAAITNLGVGLSPDPVNHAQTLEGAKLAEGDLERLLLRLLGDLA
jgi:xanthosine phosphorylase